MNKKHIQKAIHWLKNKGFEDIKVNDDSYESPSSFYNPSTKDHLIPDMTARINGNKSYIQIVSEKKDIQSLVSKWKLFAIMAKRKGGKLYLLAQHGYKSFTERLIEKYNFGDVKVISI